MSDSRHRVQALNKATVIIPCFNVEAYIHECLDSVAHQGPSAHHTYVVDNNSTDNTVKNILSWCEANPNFSLTLLSESKQGAPAARNAPLARVETKWIQFLDADDLLLPGKIAEQIHKFPDADVICASSQHISTDGSERIDSPHAVIPLGLMKGQSGNTCANLFSTSAILLIHGWDESLRSSQEYDLMFRIWQTGVVWKLDLTPRAIIRARRSGQISQQDPAAKWQQLIQLRERMLTEFTTSTELNEFQTFQLFQSFFDQLRILAKYDLNKAASLYSRMLKPIPFTPQRSDATTIAYLLCFRVLGFKCTEQLKRLLTR